MRHRGLIRRGWVGQNFYRSMAINRGNLSKDNTPEKITEY